MRQRHAMMEEIKEQSALLRSLYEGREALCADFAALYRKHRFKKILFVGNGSPYYAGYVLRFAAEALLGAEAEAVFAGVFTITEEIFISYLCIGSQDPGQKQKAAL